MSWGSRDKPLADDPGFLASLGDLDRGLAEGDLQRGGTRPTDRPQGPLGELTSAARVLTRPSPPGSAPHRPLLEIFPTEPLRLPVSPSAVPPITADAPCDQPTYGHFYGLHEPPFDDDPNLSFYYHSAEHDRVTQQMLAAIGRRDTLVLLTGQAGVGKTMLCHALAEQLDQRTLTSFLAEPAPSMNALLKTLLVDFGVISARDLETGRLVAATQAELTTALGEFLLSLLTLQAFAVVIVDEAQRLSAEMLEQIVQLTEIGGDSALLQVVLVGQPDLLGVLSRSKLRQRVDRTPLKCKLAALAADEVPGYVMHRLRVAGDHPRIDFTERGFSRIFTLTEGVPRTINVLCDAALRVGFEKSASEIDEPLVNRAAEQLDLAPPGSPLKQRLAIAALLVLSLLVGAGVGAVVFRADLAAILHH